MACACYVDHYHFLFPKQNDKRQQCYLWPQVAYLCMRVMLVVKSKEFKTMALV